MTDLSKAVEVAHCVVHAEHVLGIHAAAAIIQAALDHARAEGAAEADARAVAWLRLRWGGSYYVRILAVSIERGDHLTPAQETE